MIRWAGHWAEVKYLQLLMGKTYRKGKFGRPRHRLRVILK